jgi:hypothetical protein
MGCLISQTNRILVLVTKNKEQLECLPLRRQQDYNYGWGGNCGTNTHLYALYKFKHYSDDDLDFSREYRINHNQLLVDLKTNVVDEIRKHLITNREMLNNKEKIGREELIYVYNWMKLMKSKYNEEMENLYFVYKCVFVNDTFPYTTNVNILKQSVHEHPFEE